MRVARGWSEGIRLPIALLKESECIPNIRPTLYPHPCDRRRRSRLMVRLFTTLCGVIALALFTNASGPAADDPPDNTPQRGEMSKVDATGGTFTVKLRDKDGKEFEKIFKLTGEAKCY